MDITRSNLPPSAKEETLLRALLKQKRVDLVSIDESITKAHIDVVSSQLTIEKLNEASKLASSTLEAYKEYKSHLLNSQNLFREHISAVQQIGSIGDPDFKSCGDLYTLLTSDINSLQARVEAEIWETDKMSIKLQAVALEINEDLRCQRYIEEIKGNNLEKHTMAHQIISASVARVEGAFRVIKRIPDEIWSEIFGHVAYEESFRWLSSTDGALLLPALPLAHVCRGWRRVAGGTTNVWRKIACQGVPEGDSNMNLLMLWGTFVKHGPIYVSAQQPYVKYIPTNLVTQANIRSNQLITFEMWQSDREHPIAEREQPPLPHPTQLRLLSSNKRVAKTMQAELLNQFSNIQSLEIVNLLPSEGLALPSSLTSLELYFDVIHKPYSLQTLLIPTLVTLRLQHSQADGVPTLPQRFQLPSLRTLRLSPLEYDIAKNIELPQLSTLIITAPIEGALFPDQWLDSFVPLCVNVTNLTLIGAKRYRETNGWEILPPFVELRPHARKLRGVSFERGTLEGTQLVALFEKIESSEENCDQRLRN